MDVILILLMALLLGLTRNLLHDRFYKYFKWILRNSVLKWWIEKVYDGVWMQKDVMVVGDAKQVSRWDGGDCHPWTE